MGKVTDEDLCTVLEVLLETVLFSKPYPGQEASSSFFPDIEIVEDIHEIVVSNRNIGSPCRLEIPGKNIILLSDEEIKSRTEEYGDFPYFSIAKLDIGDNEVTLSLQLTWAMSELSKQAGKFFLSGGGIQVRFLRLDGEWKAPTGPISTWMT